MKIKFSLFILWGGVLFTSILLQSCKKDQNNDIDVFNGTGSDRNPDKTTMNFVIITPQGGDAVSQTKVRLYNFEAEGINEMARDSLRL